MGRDCNGYKMEVEFIDETLKLLEGLSENIREKISEDYEANAVLSSIKNIVKVLYNYKKGLVLEAYDSGCFEWREMGGGEGS